MSTTTTTAVETISAPEAQPKRRPGRPALYTAEERAERARAATKRSQQRRTNRIAGDLDVATENLVTINVSRLSKEDKARVAQALQSIANTRAEFTIKPVDVPDNEWGETETHAQTAAPVEVETEQEPESVEA